MKAWSYVRILGGFKLKRLNLGGILLKKDAGLTGTEPLIRIKWGFEIGGFKLQGNRCMIVYRVFLYILSTKYINIFFIIL